MFKLGSHAGKGAAVRAGVARATGHNIVFMDADLATDLDFLDPLVTSLDEVDIAIGSRSAPGAITSGVTPSSDAAHRLFNTLSRSLTGLPITDFQCGFKGFRASTGRLLFQLIRERGYAFDVELLALAERLGLSLREVPIHWRAVRGSHVRIVVDSAHMSYQVARIARRTRYNQTLSALEAYGSSADLPLEELIASLHPHLPVAAPIIPWAKGALVLLPFVEPIDAAELANALERSLDGVLVRPTSIAASQILDPAQRGRLQAPAPS
ncbi:glycosyltransferase [Aquihabitans daechungensis]|uniref:glycosyltransferase n=1 Tax=Aquihabitans daechungensis TaxID=1052257 RepID=UPI003B9E5A17